MRFLLDISAKFTRPLICVGLLASVSACQGGSILDRKAPFGSKVVRFGDVEVATVDGTAIYLSDVEQTARVNGAIGDGDDLTPDSPIFHATLRKLIDQRVLGLAAITQSLDQTDEAKRRLALAREQPYGRFVIENILNSEVTDEDVKRLYEEQKSLNSQGEERRVRHIVVETEDEAKTVQSRLEKGEDFGTLAGILSLDETSLNNGGDLGFISRGMLGQAISDVAFSTPIGEQSEIFKSSRGYHILEVMSRRQTPQKDFAVLEPKLREYLTYEAINRTIKDLRSRSDIRLSVSPPAPSLPDQIDTAREGASSAADLK